MRHLDNFLGFLNSLPEFLIYLLLGLSAFVENVFPPIPGDTIIAFGAFLVGTKRLHFAGVFISTSLGSIAGFMFLFYVGNYLGRRFFIEKDLLVFKAQDIIRAEEWFRRYGYLLILFNRFLPGIRSVISIAGGISGLKSGKVMVLAFISAGIWNLIWIISGYTLGNNWEAVRGQIGHLLIRYNVIVLILFCLIILFFAVKKVRNRRRNS